MSSNAKSKSGRSFKPNDIVEETRLDAAEKTWARATPISALRHTAGKSGQRRQAKALGTIKARLISRTIELVPEQVKIAVDDDYQSGLLSIRWRGHGRLHLPSTTQLPEYRVPVRQLAATAGNRTAPHRAERHPFTLLAKEPVMKTIVTSFFCPSFILAAALLAGSLFGQPTWAAELVVRELATPTPTVDSGPTSRQQQWLNATPEQRVRLAEVLGEDGARAFARSKGWTPLADGTQSTLRQGFDQVYRSADNVVHVVEAKGGSSKLGRAYGFQQGTPEWAVRAAERTLTSPNASGAEKDAARALLGAAQRGNLQVHVVRTSHVLGEPTAAVLQQTMRSGDDAARLATSVIDDFAKRGITVADGVARASRNARAAVHAVDDAARVASSTVETASTGNRALRGVARVAIPVAVGLDAGLRVSEGASVERQFADGALTQQQRESAHARNVAGMAGGWTGALPGAKLGAVSGGAAGTCVAPGLGTAIGAGAGAVAGGVAGYIGGEAAAEAAANWTVGKVHEAGTTVAESTTAAWNATKGAATTAGSACGQAWTWTSSKASSAWNWVAGD